MSLNFGGLKSMSPIHSLVSNFNLDELCILKIELASGLMNFRCFLKSIGQYQDYSTAL